MAAPAVLSKSSIRATATGRLREKIKSAYWEPGAFLPTEEELVRELTVSRSTVRLALRELEVEGLLVAMRGRGRIVAPQAQAKPPVGIASRTVVILTTVPGDPSSQITGHDKAVEAGVVDAVHGAGLHALVANVKNLSGLEVDQLLSSAPYGMVATHQFAQQPEGRAIMDAAADRGIAVIAHGEGPGLGRFDRVVSDHGHGGFLLTKHLIEKGCKRILLLWPDPDRHYWFEAREQAYIRAMREAGLEPMESIRMELVSPRPPERDAYNLRTRSRQYAGYLVEHLIPKRQVDAVILGTDLDVFPAAQACRRCGVVPGRDVLLGGFDNWWHFCWEREFDPVVPTATVEKHNGAMGGQLLGLLEDRVNGRLPEAPQRVLNTPELVVPPPDPVIAVDEPGSSHP